MIPRATSLLLLIAPVVLFILALRDRRQAFRPAGRKLLLAVYVIPVIAPLIMAVFWRFSDTRIVIELRGVAFRALGDSPIRKVIMERRVGGGRIVIGDAPRRRTASTPSLGTITFNPTTHGSDKNGIATLELPRPQLRSGIIGAGSDGLLGSTALEDGDDICIDGDCWKYDASERSFFSSHDRVRIPRRMAKLPGIDFAFPLRWASPVTAGLRTYPLQWLARRGAAAGAPQQRVRSFLCYARPGPRLRLVLLDSSVSVVRKGSAVAIPSSLTIDAEHPLAFYSLPPESDVFAAPGITERRSVVYRPGKRSFAIELDTPEVHSLAERELDRLTLGNAERRKKTPTVGLSMGNAQMADRSLYFSGISESVALQANSLFEFPRFFPHNIGTSFRIVSPRGPTDASLGDVAWIGATDLAAVRLDVLRPPLLLLLIGLLLQLCKWGAAIAARFTTNQALLAGTLECLVGVRLLLGHRIWALPPHEVEGIELALVVWIALPWFFLAASAPVTVSSSRGTLLRDLPKEPWLPAAAGLLFSAIFCLRVVDEPKKAAVWVACHLLAVGVALIREPRIRDRAVAWTRAATAKLRQWLRSFAARLASSGVARSIRDWIISDTLVVRLILGTAAAVTIWLIVRTFADPLWIVGFELLFFIVGCFVVPVVRFVRDRFDVELRPWLYAASLFFFFRFFLVLLGFKESVPVGGTRLALSAIYVPAALILEATFLWTLWQRLQRNDRLMPSDVAASAVIMFFVWVAPALVTSDIGLALQHLPVFAFLLADCRHARARQPAASPVDRMLQHFPAAVIVAVLLFVAIAPAWRLVMPLFGSDEKLLERASDSNFARFIHFAEPEQLKELATKQGESLAVTSAILQRYINTGVIGRGYGTSDISPHLADTALRDFAPAVFVAAEWGFVGTFAMLLVYGLFAVIGRLATPWARNSGEPATVGGVIEYAAAATIAIASIYMVLANHELLLLTGKNAYLLGLDSAGDVLESLLIVLLIAFGSATLRDTAPTPVVSATGARS